MLLKIFYRFVDFFPVCHHIRAYTFSLNGYLMPLCSRCTGIYSGFLVTLLFQVLCRRTANKYPARPVALFFLFSLVLLVLHSLSAGPFLWLDTNPVRLVTGLLFGSAISVLLFPLFNGFFFRRNIRKSSVGVKDFFLLIGILTFFYALYFVRIYKVFLLLSTISLAGLVTLYAMLNVLAAAVIAGWHKKKEKNILFKLRWFCTAILFFALEIFILRNNPLSIFRRILPYLKVG